MRHRVKIQHLPAKLRAVRKHLGLSQSKFAARITSFDLDIGRVSDYERGKRTPNLLILLDYARLAGIHIDDLIDDSRELQLIENRR
jgi:transcriptional regulator with XRE-family HTH domain